MYCSTTGAISNHQEFSLQLTEGRNHKALNVQEKQAREYLYMHTNKQTLDPDKGNTIAIQIDL